MSVAAKSQPAQALEQANAIRIGRARQRRALQGAPAQAIYAAVVDPTVELRTYTLGSLFAPAKNHKAGGGPLIWRFGRKSLLRALGDLSIRYPQGRRQYHLNLRLDELTRFERERLMKVIARRAPEKWRAELEPPKRRAEG